MGKKKGGKGKKDKGGSGAEKEEKFVLLTETRKTEMEFLKDRFVVLKMNLMNWEYMNEELVFKESAHIFQVKDKLRHLHGRITGLRVAKAVFDPASFIGDDYVELEHDDFLLKTKHMKPAEVEAFKAEQEKKRKEGMGKDMKTLADYGELCKI